MGEMSEYYRDFQAEANEDMDIKNELIINKKGKIMEMTNPFEKCGQCKLKEVHTCERKPNKKKQNKALNSLIDLVDYINGLEQSARFKVDTANAELTVLKMIKMEASILLEQAKKE